MSQMNRKTTELDSAIDKDSEQLDTAMLGSAIATEKLAPSIEKNRDEIRTLSNRLGTLASKLGHTLDKPRATITIKRFLILLILFGSVFSGIGAYYVYKHGPSIAGFFENLGVHSYAQLQSQNAALVASINETAKAQSRRADHERQLSFTYQAISKERVAGLEEHVMQLNESNDDLTDQLGSQQRKSRAMRMELTTLRKTVESERMLNEAYSTIALNRTPLDLQQYFTSATEVQWEGYAQMAVDRRADNVVRTIKSIDHLMAMPEVAKIVESYEANEIQLVRSQLDQQVKLVLILRAVIADDPDFLEAKGVGFNDVPPYLITWFLKPENHKNNPKMIKHILDWRTKLSDK